MAAFHRIPLQLHYPNEDQPLKIIMSFLTSYGLNDPAHYTSVDVAAVLRTYTDRFIELTRPTCKQIVTIQFSWNVLSIVWPPHMEQYISPLIAMYHPTMTNLIRLQRDTMIPALLVQVREYLMYADALVWADIALREGTPDVMTIEQVLDYRHRQIQPVMDRIVNFITELYAWVVKMWAERWRTEGRYHIPPPVVFPNPGSFVFVPLIERSPPPVYDAPLTSTPVIENRTLSPNTPPSARGVTVGSPPFSPRSPSNRVAVPRPAVVCFLTTYLYVN
ncbi:hypothetical protein R3P38DRAFT_3612443 [Favolaschia claudopus]|uniref:Uncharacterized protein n=1 Tax=Favolaschia claudopus TaxID=2862362 RepID=A0AAW0A7L5_9AGAR